MSLFFGAKAFGSVIAAWQSTSLMEFYGNRGIFLFSSVLPLVIMIYTSFIFEEYYDPATEGRYNMNWGSLKGEVKRVYSTLSHKEVKLFLLVVFLLTMTPSLSSTFNFFYTVELKFNLITMSQISLVASIAYLLSILAINFVFREIEFKKFYVTTGILINLLNLASLIIVLKKHETLSISATFICYLLNSMLVFTHELNFLPLLGTCCRLCPEDLEGTTYGLFTSLFNFGYYLATIWASVLLIILGVSTRNYSNLWMVVVIQVIYGTIIILWLGFLKFPNPDRVMEDEFYKRPLVQVPRDQNSSESDEEENLPLTKS